MNTPQDTDEDSTPQHWLSKAQAARYIGCHTNSLDRWHALGAGPRRVKLGDGSRAHIRYRRDELDAWMDSRTDVA